MHKQSALVSNLAFGLFAAAIGVTFGVWSANNCKRLLLLELSKDDGGVEA